MIRLTPLRWLFSLVSPRGKRARLSILIFHRVLSEADPMRPEEIDRVTFYWQMQLLARHCNVLSLTAAVARLRACDLPARSVCVTFDDGYADNVTTALPILQEFGIPATFFIASGFLDGGLMWNDAVIETIRRTDNDVLDLSARGLGLHRLHTTADRVAAIGWLLPQLKYLPVAERDEQVGHIVELSNRGLPRDLMMSTMQLRSLHAAGMDIGAHTVNHPILARLSDEQAKHEIGEGKQRLEGILGASVNLFAYPNGKPTKDYLPEHARMVERMGFDAALTTAWGVSKIDDDPWQLPRFTPWDATPDRYLARLVWNCWHATARPA